VGATQAPTASAAASASSANTAAGSSGSSTLSFILSDVLARATTAGDPAIRATVAGLYRSLIPLLTPAQVRDPFFPAVRRLAGDMEPAVIKAAVGALATVYSAPACNDEGVRGELNDEVSRLLGAGPRDIIILILRALIRAVPFAAPPLRDEFILDRLLELNARIVDAAAAGAQAMREIVESFGLTGGTSGGRSGELHDAAKDAVKKARRAAMQVRRTAVAAVEEGVGQRRLVGEAGAGEEWSAPGLLSSPHACARPSSWPPAPPPPRRAASRGRAPRWRTWTTSP
jgi:hypothetical protein